MLVKSVKAGAGAMCSFVLLLTSACSAADYWVSPAGEDSASGAQEKPFRTIQRGVNAAQAGDNVFVRAGRYEEHVNLAAGKDGQPDKWITIAAAPGDERKAVVGTEQPQVDAYCALSSGFFLQGVRYVRVRGFKCVSAYRGRGSGIGAKNCEHIEILNCEVLGGGQGGVDANNCDFVTVDGVEAYFTGGGTGWSSGISLFEPKGKENVIRNCVCYGNFDNSSYRTDGNGIIVDNGYAKGGALLANNLCYMNGGKGISSTRTDNCMFLNNTSVANCWQPNQQATAHELSIRGANNVVRNNIGVGTLDKAAGMLVLPEYSGPMGNVKIDLASISCDHNLSFNPRNTLFAEVAGNRMQLFTLDALRKDHPNWAADSLSLDPGFVDLVNLDFRLRPDSPALRAGVTQAQAPVDLLGKARAKDGSCSLGCYEGGFAAAAAEQVKAGVEIAAGEDEPNIRALLASKYDLQWHGMLWGWGKMLKEELPLEAEVLGTRKADFLNLEGAFVLKDLLEQVSREHNVRLLLRQPAECKGLPATPQAVNRHLMIRDQAGEEEQTFVRRALRMCVWTAADKDRISLAEILAPLTAATGLKIESHPPLPPDRKFTMITLNMPLGAVLTDLAGRMNVKLTLSKEDPLSGKVLVQEAQLDQPFGTKDGLVEVTIEKPDARGLVNLFARVQAQSCVCARLFHDNSRMMSLAGMDGAKPGALFHKADARLDPGSVVRLALIGDGYALNVGGGWLMLGRMPPGLAEGQFQVRAVSQWVKVGKVRFVPISSGAGTGKP